MSVSVSQPTTLRKSLLEKTSTGRLWAKEKDGIRCFACGHRCFIPEGRDGICKVRSNIAGELKVPWGYVGGIQIDPIEKKPFFHVLPGSNALSFGMLGCDLHCAYCQNWFTSQSIRDPKAMAKPIGTSAENLAQEASAHGCPVITSTYNEPLITSEWAVHVFEAAKKRGVRGAFVSNGNATPEVLEYLRPHVEFFKVDLKSFRDKNYRSLGTTLENVCRSIEQIHAMGFWLEIVTLVIPGFNDSPEELKDLTQFVKGVSPLIPWHATGFHKDYKMTSPEDTSEATLLLAGELGKESGLKFVYLGNRPGRVGNWENTLCPKCDTVLIERIGFRVLSNSLQAGKCPKCDVEIPGVWK